MNFVSIIIVNYNGAHHLQECFQSLKALDYPKDRYEVILFDNGSGDNSIETAKKLYPEVRILESTHNLGFAAPHRIAAKEAKGDVLAFLNNDMKVDKGWIKEGAALLNRETGVVCVSSKILDWQGKHIDFFGGTLQYLGYADQLDDHSLKHGDPILFPCGGAMFIDKDVFVNSGGFDDDYFAIYEDVDLGWRLWLMGCQVVLSGKSLTYHKGHSTLDTKNVAKKRFLMHRNGLMTIIKNYDETNLSKVLPLALVFAVKRALLKMGVDKRSYYFWEKMEVEQGMPDDYVDALVHLAALDDVFSTYDTLTAKRKQVQQMRKRKDEEIFRLFRDPFRNIMGYKEYVWDEALLFGDFSLHEIFRCNDEYHIRLEEGLHHARHTLKQLRHEIHHTPARISKDGTTFMSYADKFYRHLRINGVGMTAKKTGRFLLKKVGRSGR